MSDVIKGDFRKPSIDDLYSLPITYTDNVIEVDFRKPRADTDKVVDIVLEEAAREYKEDPRALYLYADYLGSQGFDEEDVYTVLEAIVNPGCMQYADHVVKDLVHSYNDYVEMC